MKLRVKVEITSRNVANAKGIRKDLERAASRCVYTNGKKWITRNYYNWVINNGTATQLHLQGTTVFDNQGRRYPQEESWLKPALERGENVYYVNQEYNVFPGGVNIQHVVDFLNTQDRDWSRINVPDMEILVKKWDEELKRQKQGKVNKEDYKHLFNSGSYQWVEILTPEGLKDEGAKMGHCVGGDYYCLQLGKGTRIFSLRDKNFDNPHVTVEMGKDGFIDQIQGKQNTAQPKYSSNVVDFLNKAVKPSLRKRCLGDIPEAGREWGFMYYDYEQKFYSRNERPNPLIFGNTGILSSLYAIFDPYIIEDRDIILPKAEEFILHEESITFRSIKVPNGTVTYWQRSYTEVPKDFFNKIQAKALRLTNFRRKSIRIPLDLSNFGKVVLKYGKFIIPKKAIETGKIRDERPKS